MLERIAIRITQLTFVINNRFVLFQFIKNIQQPCLTRKLFFGLVVFLEAFYCIVKCITIACFDIGILACQLLA